MAKHKRRHTNSTLTRDLINQTYGRSLTDRLPSNSWVNYPPPDPIEPIGLDRRYWHPDPLASWPVTTLALQNTLSVYPVDPPRAAPRSKRRQFRAQDVPVHIGFAEPRLTPICVRRHRRREVLHAFKKTGRGTYRKHPRRNRYSNIKC